MGAKIQMKKAKRDSRFELLRIIGMLLIVGCHTVGHGVFLIYGNGEADYQNYLGGGIINRILAGAFAPGGNMGNAIFFLLMGYFYDFQYSNRQRIHKLLVLAIEVYFYVAVALFIWAFFCFTGIYTYDDLGLEGIVRVIGSMILPMESECWWFITTYVFIFVILGGLSFLDRLSGKSFRRLLLFCFLTGLARPFHSGSYNKILQWSFVVLIGIYIRKFVNVERLREKRLLLVAMCCLSWFLAIGSVLFFYRYHLQDASFLMRAASRVVNSAGFYVEVLFAVCMLLLFMTVEIDDCPLINNVSSSTFAVYLFHGSPFFVYSFFKHLNFITVSYRTVLFPLVFCMTIIGIFAVSLLLDKIQRKCNPKALAKMNKAGSIFFQMERDELE